MLPAHLSYFLARGQRPHRGSASDPPGAAWSGASPPVIVVFATGTIISNLSRAYQAIPYLTVVIGWSSRRRDAWSSRCCLPKLGAPARELGSMFVFGVSYAVASRAAISRSSR
jgi:hypothetical protein